MNRFAIRQEGDRVLLIKDGALVAEMPWEAAEALGLAIRSKAKLAEEHAKADSIIKDQAIVMKAGMPFGLSNDPDIIAEAVKAANSDRDLRRYMGAGIRSTGAVGTPTVICRRPKRRLR